MNELSPGPWRFHDTKEILDSRGCRIVTPNDPSELVDSDDLEVIVSDADGLLMAAALDAIDAVRRLLPIVKAEYNADSSFGDEDTEAAIKAGEAAIAKAESEGM